MKKWLIPVIIIVVVIFGIYRWAVGFNNEAVRLNENIGEAWGNVQTSYQRRNDLIGNLVNTVKGKEVDNFIGGGWSELKGEWKPV